MTRNMGVTFILLIHIIGTSLAFTISDNIVAQLKNSNDVSVLNPNNCTTFFHLVNGEVLEESCPNGSFYNPSSSMCDPNYECLPGQEEQVSTENGVTTDDGQSVSEISTISISETTLASGEDNETLSTVTVTTITAETVDDNSFTTILSTIAEWFTVEAGTERTEEHTDNDDDDNHSVTTESIPSPSGNNNNSDLCPAQTDSLEPIFVSSKEDCEKYYICLNAQPVQLNCIEGMHWNQEKMQCDWPEQANCLIPKNTTSTDFPQCPRKGWHITPHPTICQYFVSCVNGIPSIQQCDSHFQFDVFRGRCVFEDDAKCILDVNVTDK